MRGNSYGQILTMTSFGESHGKAMGVVVDGVPPNLEFNQEALQACLDARAPGRQIGTSSRKEPDLALVLSGIFENKTLGSPIAVIVENKDAKSEDYEKLKNQHRKGHADKTYDLKYGIRDHRGGGRSSGRETISRVIAGYFAGLIIPEIIVEVYIKRSGPFQFQGSMNQNETKQFQEFLLDLKKSGNSIGGVLGIKIKNCPPGLGEPVFNKLKSNLAEGILSIGACVGFSYGVCEEFYQKTGKEILKLDNPFGGMEGGISNGEEIYFEATFKPTSTVGQKALEGRHDPCILPRAIPVVESMVKFILADHYLLQKTIRWS